MGDNQVQSVVEETTNALLCIASLVPPEDCPSGNGTSDGSIGGNPGEATRLGVYRFWGMVPVVFSRQMQQGHMLALD